MQVSFSQGRVVLDAQVHARVILPLHPLEFALSLHALAEPIISSEYAVKLQSVDVKVTSTDTRLSIADKIASIYDTIGTAIGDKGEGLRLRPQADGGRRRRAHCQAHRARPGRRQGVRAAEGAGHRGRPRPSSPTAWRRIWPSWWRPSVVLPCPDEVAAGAGAGGIELPPLANVATIVPGPFTVTVPLAARYEELTRAMSAAFTDGKLFFSKDFPQLYMEKPELYQSEGRLVLKLHLQGPVHKLGIDANLDGDIFLAGHPAVVDNELSIPDLEPTIETKNFLLSLKAATDGENIKNQARQALRLDIGDRLEPGEAEALLAAPVRGGGRLLPRRRRPPAGDRGVPARRLPAHLRRGHRARARDHAVSGGRSAGTRSSSCALRSIASCRCPASRRRGRRPA